MPRGVYDNARRSPGRPFQRGFDPRRNVGRPALGMSFREWANELARTDDGDQPAYTVGDLREIADAPDSAAIPVAKRLAAVRLLEALKGGRRGKESFDALLNRVSGYPTASVVVDDERSLQSRIAFLDSEQYAAVQQEYRDSYDRRRLLLADGDADDGDTADG